MAYFMVISNLRNKKQNKRTFSVALYMTLQYGDEKTTRISIAWKNELEK